MNPTEPVAQLLISMTADGQVQAQWGNVNLVVLLGMIETAKSSILKKFGEPSRETVVVAPAGLDLSRLKHGRNGG